MGLRDTHHVGRIVIHPTNPDIGFVAALGHLWGPNASADLYRTKDGGATWQNVLTIDDDTGVVDVAIDRRRPNACSPRRISAGGAGGAMSAADPGARLYRSLDGATPGRSSAAGLPSGDARTHRRRHLAEPARHRLCARRAQRPAAASFVPTIAARRGRGRGTFNPRPSYYSQIRDRSEESRQRSGCSAASVVRLTAARRSAAEHTTDHVHTDHHALWIDPSNTDHLMLGNDGGAVLLLRRQQELGVHRQPADRPVLRRRRRHARPVLDLWGHAGQRLVGDSEPRRSGLRGSPTRTS